MADTRHHLAAGRCIPDCMSHLSGSKRAVRDIGSRSCRRDLGYSIESAQPSLLLFPLFFALCNAKVGRRYALQYVLQRPNVSQNACNAPPQIGRQPLQKLKSALDSRRTDCGKVIRPELSKSFRPQKLIFRPVLLQRYSQRCYRGEDRGQFGGDVRENDNCFASAVISLRFRYRLTFDSDLLCTAFGQTVSLLTELPYSDAGNDSGQHSPKSHNQRSCGKQCCEQRDCNCPSVPPNNTIAYARLHARAHTTPQIANPAHFLVPLWTGWHSAMPMQQVENAHG